MDPSFYNEHSTYILKIQRFITRLESVLNIVIFSSSTFNQFEWFSLIDFLPVQYLLIL